MIWGNQNRFTRILIMRQTGRKVDKIAGQRGAIFDRGSRGRESDADDTGAKFRNILLSIVKSFIGAQRLLLRRDAIESTSYN